MRIVFHASHVSQRSCPTAGVPGAGVAGRALSCSGVYSATGIRIAICTSQGGEVSAELSAAEQGTRPGRWGEREGRAYIDVPARGESAVDCPCVVWQVFLVLCPRRWEDDCGEAEVRRVLNLLPERLQSE